MLIKLFLNNAHQFWRSKGFSSYKTGKMITKIAQPKTSAFQRTALLSQLVTQYQQDQLNQHRQQNTYKAGTEDTPINQTPTH